MLKIGIIGLGDIAKKAYLPVITTLQVELHLYSRNLVAAHSVASTYRLSHVYESLESLVNTGIDGAFVHAATSAHFDIVQNLLIMVCILTWISPPLTTSAQRHHYSNWPTQKSDFSI